MRVLHLHIRKYIPFLPMKLTSFTLCSIIKQLPLDYMHLVCFGVMRCILFYLKGGYPLLFSGRLASADLIEISNCLSELKGKLPSDFAKEPRELTKVNQWKVTEFRTFLLYTDIVVLKDVLEPKRYKHFLSLALAICMLCEEEANLRYSYLNSARQLLNYFVTNEHEMVILSLYTISITSRTFLMMLNFSDPLLIFFMFLV